MDLSFITEMYIPVIVVICLCVGYVYKKFFPADDKFIPLILFVLGAILGCVVNNEITVNSVAAGMVSGLGSVGLHQLFKQLIEGGKVPVLAPQEMVDEATVRATVEALENEEDEEGDEVDA